MTDDVKDKQDQVDGTTDDQVKDDAVVDDTSDKQDQDTSKEDVKEDDGKQDTDDTSDTGGVDEDTDLDLDVWGGTGDDVGDSVLQLLQNSGTTPETAKALLWDAVRDGDVTKIDRDALVEAVGKTKANLIMAGMENYVGRIVKRTAEVTKVVNEAVGGKENWEAIREWAKKNVSEADMLAYADMVDQGGRKAKLAARDLKEQFEEAGNTLKAAKEVTPSGKGRDSAVEPLSRTEYFKQVEALNKSGTATRSALDQLWKARELGMAQGKQ